MLLLLCTPFFSLARDRDRLGTSDADLRRRLADDHGRQRRGHLRVRVRRRKHLSLQGDGELRVRPTRVVSSLQCDVSARHRQLQRDHALSVVEVWERRDHVAASRVSVLVGDHQTLVNRVKDVRLVDGVVDAVDLELVSKRSLRFRRAVERLEMEEVGSCRH